MQLTLKKDDNKDNSQNANVAIQRQVVDSSNAFLFLKNKVDNRYEVLAKDEVQSISPVTPSTASSWCFFFK
jgi:hypothetical protein